MRPCRERRLRTRPRRPTARSGGTPPSRVRRRRRATKPVMRPCESAGGRAWWAHGGVLPGEEPLVLEDDALRVALGRHAARVQPQRAVAERRHEVHGVAAEEDRLARGLELEDAVDALLLEAAVAHGERLVEEDHVGQDGRRDREREPHLHARGVRLDGPVEEVAELGEGLDLGQRRRRLPRARAPRARPAGSRCAGPCPPDGRPSRARGSTPPGPAGSRCPTSRPSSPRGS